MSAEGRGGKAAPAWRPELDDLDRLRYTSQRERRHSEPATNGPETPDTVQGKSVDAETFARAGIPVPDTLHRLRIDGGDPALTAVRGALRRVLKAAEGAAVVVKPEHGMRGDHILVIHEHQGDELRLSTGEVLDIAGIALRLARTGEEAWRIERWIAPHSDLAGFQPGVSPTVRGLTLLLDGGPVLHTAALKVPISRKGVDNLHAGNLAAGIDLDTGRLGCATDLSGVVWHDRHPGTGRPIEGVDVPHWSAVRDVLLRGAALRPQDARALGWDVVIGRDGPVVLEANRSWGEDLAQLPVGSGVMHGGMLKLLHEVGAQGLLVARRRLLPSWEEFERREVAAYC